MMRCVALNEQGFLSLDPRDDYGPIGKRNLRRQAALWLFSRILALRICELACDPFLVLQQP